MILIKKLKQILREESVPTYKNYGSNPRPKGIRPKKPGGKTISSQVLEDVDLVV